MEQISEKDFRIQLRIATDANGKTLVHPIAIRKTTWFFNLFTRDINYSVQSRHKPFEEFYLYDGHYLSNGFSTKYSAIKATKKAIKKYILNKKSDTIVNVEVIDL